MRDYKTALPNILKKSFPNTLTEATAILSKYDGQERERVFVGIIRLSNGDLKDLEKWTTIACTDYRDVLLNAEYWLSADLNLPAEAKRSAQLQEASEYEAWFKEMAAV